MAYTQQTAGSFAPKDYNMSDMRKQEPPAAPTPDCRELELESEMLVRAVSSHQQALCALADRLRPVIRIRAASTETGIEPERANPESELGQLMRAQSSAIFSQTEALYSLLESLAV